MPESFDPYYAWLEIPPEEQPPNHYRLLGIDPFEDRRELVERAAEQRVGMLHAFRSGEHSKIATRLLNEVAAAKVCLLNPNRKSGYDAGLQKMLQAREAAIGKTDASQRARCEAFLLVLEEKDLLSRDLIESLRKQVSGAKQAVSAETVAGRLVEKKHLTAALAKRLLAAAEERYVPPVLPSAPVPLTPSAPMPQSAPMPPPAPMPPIDDTPGEDATELDDLSLAPLEEEKPAKKPSPPEEELGFAPLEEDRRAKKTVRPQPKRPPAQAPKQAPTPKNTPVTKKAPTTKQAPTAKKTPTTKKAPASKSPPQQPAKTPEPPMLEPAAAGGSLIEEELHELDGDVAGGMGPLDGLMDDAASGGPLMTVKSKRKGLSALFSRKNKQPKVRKENVWDSPLILIGGGALMVLLILFAVLYWALSRGSADDALAEAEGEYQDGRYTQAIHKYDQYLKDYPNHVSVSKARVNRGLAVLRKETKKRESTDWIAAQETAKKVLKEISSEDEFPSAHNDLWSILPTIAEQLAEQAKKKPDPKLVDLAVETLALTEKYVPRRLRTGEKIPAINETLNYVRRELSRDKEVVKTIQAMKKAVAAGDTQQAYAVYGALLSKYPLLEGPRFEEALLEVSQAQQAAVKFVAETIAAIAPDPADKPPVTLLLAQQITPGNVAAAAGKSAFALDGGAVYALDAATGRVRWRHVVGIDPNASRAPFPPTPLSPAAGADVIAVDPVRREILCLKADTGDTRWRHPIGEPFDAHPLIVDDRILVATRAEDGRSGRVVVIDAATGSSDCHFRLPQPLHVAPAVGLVGSRKVIFQLADHSNLFVLSMPALNADTGRCETVYHFGHQRDSIAVPPVMFQKLLMLTVNEGTKSSTLRVFKVAAGEEGIAVEPVQRFELVGRVNTAPLTSDKRVLVVTDRGIASIFDPGDAEANTALEKFPQSTNDDDQTMTRFALFPGDRFYIADSRLLHFEIQSSDQRLALQWPFGDGCAFLQPPVAIAKMIVSVRRKPGLPGAFVAAVAATAADPDQLWETYLAAPPATEPTVDATGTRIVAVNALGALYRMDAAAVKPGAVVDRPATAVSAAAVRAPIDCVVRLPGGLLAMTAGEGSREIAVVDPAQPVLPQQFTLPTALTCRPIAFAGGLLAPTQAGQVFLLDPRTGKNMAKPFPPELEAGVQLEWREPVAIGPPGQQTEAVLSDGRTKLYRMGFNDKPLPHLGLLAEVDLPRPIVSPLALAGNTVYAVDLANALVAFALPDLARTDVRSLSGRCVWGPRRVGDRVMLATDDNQLLCLDAAGKVAWQQPLPYGPLAGMPLEIGDGYVLASTSGVVWIVNKADGEALRRNDAPRKVDVARPLGSGAVSLGNKLLVGGRDGCLYLIEQP